jgi:hypothetical protein
MAIPIINGLSDHDVQLLIIITSHPHVRIHNFKMTRNINKYTVYDFIANLSYESWDSVFSGKDVNTMYNSFLNTYLRIFYSSFPLKKVTTRNKHDNSWINLGIKTLCYQHYRFKSCNGPTIQIQTLNGLMEIHSFWL